MNKWAYLAGLVDGDGSIYISERGGNRGFPGHGYYRLIVAISNCNLYLLRYLRKTFGQAYTGWKSDNYYAGRIAWEGPKAKEIAQKLLPHLIAKKKQARLALRFPTLGKGAPGIKRRDLPKIHSVAQQMFEQMSAMNAQWSMGKVRGARKSKNRRYSI